jgi:hypothetical protein
MGFQADLTSKFLEESRKTCCWIVKSPAKAGRRISRLSLVQYHQTISDTLGYYCIQSLDVQ